MENQKISLRVLCLCDTGENRSPVAVNVLHEIAHEKGFRLEAEPIGFDYLKDLPQEGVTHRIAGVDAIYVTDKKMGDSLVSEYGVPKNKIVNLDIPRQYERDNPELRALLEKRLRSLFN